MRHAPRWIPILLGAAALLFGVQPAAAQNPGAVPDSAALDTLPRRGGSLIPFPILFYQPETGTGFGASVIYLFTMGGSTRRGDGAKPFQSSISATAIYTAKKQTVTTLEASLFPGGGRYRVLFSVAFQRFPSTFWGLGNDSPDSLEEDYTPDVLAASGEFQAELAKHTYAGAFGDVANRKLREIAAGGLIDAGDVPGVEDGTMVRLGLLATRDSRDSNVFPRRGEYHQLRASRSFDASGNGNDFSTFSLDLRTYAPIRSGVVALRALGIASGDTPPFDLMPQLGGSSLLRGYFGGRFRDRSLAAFEAEYRSPMWKRVRFAAFAGAGQVADGVGGLGWDGFHPSAGIGFRFLLNRKEGFQVRADLGWGFDVESSGFYLGFGEVF